MTFPRHITGGTTPDLLAVTKDMLRKLLQSHQIGSVYLELLQTIAYRSIRPRMHPLGLRSSLPNDDDTLAGPAASGTMNGPAIVLYYDIWFAHASAFVDNTSIPGGDRSVEGAAVYNPIHWETGESMWLLTEFDHMALNTVESVVRKEMKNNRCSPSPSNPAQSGSLSTTGVSGATISPLEGASRIRANLLAHLALLKRGSENWQNILRWRYAKIENLVAVTDPVSPVKTQPPEARDDADITRIPLSHGSVICLQPKPSMSMSETSKMLSCGSRQILHCCKRSWSNCKGCRLPITTTSLHNRPPS